MTFTPPSIEKLVENTNKLEERFSIQLNRYSIKKPESIKKQTDLSWWFARTQGVVDCKTGRDTAHEVFNQLVNELRHVNAEDPVQNKKATSFLVGALLHRYFRILQEYDDYNAYLSLLWRSYPGNCRLFIAIRAALKFPEVTSTDAKSFTTEDFKKKDIECKENPLGMDNASIVIHLETFRDNMLLEDEKKEPRYKKYEHLKKDINFEKHLNEIITFYKARAAPVLKQLKAIQFIESLTIDVIAKCKLQISALDEWHKRLVKDHPNFSTLDLNTIEAHIETHVKEDEVKEQLLDLLNTKRIKDKLTAFEFNHESFLSAVNKASKDSAVYTIVGGYCLLLQTEGVEQLKFNLYTALGVEEHPEELTEQDKLNGIKLLEQFIEANEQAALNYDFFNGKDRMVGALDKAKKDLIRDLKRIEEQKSQAEVAQIVLV